jgi:hypothetical protein
MLRKNMEKPVNSFSPPPHREASSLPSSSSSLRTLREWAVKERDYWDERNADRFWQMSRVVHQIDAALLSPVEGYDQQVRDLTAERDMALTIANEYYAVMQEQAAELRALRRAKE